MIFKARTLEYIKFGTYAIMAAVIGAQTVHTIYTPMEKIDELIQIEIERIREEHKEIK